MPTPTIPDGKLFMNATLYTGTGAAQSITNGAAGQSFQPDFVWNKPRSFGTSPVNGHNTLYDSVRGATKELYSDLTSGEATNTQSVTSFNSNGFSVGTEARNNNSGSTYVGWQWKAGGAAVTNTAGSISAQVSANTTSGFSVVTYTGNSTSGATVGHGLGVSPAMIITKVRSTTGDWYAWQTTMGDNTMRLNTTAAQFPSTANGVYNTASFSSSVFALGSGVINGGGSTFVSYCWSEVAGFSKFGSYIGNGSTDGPFVYLGFRPRFVMIKRTDGGTANWYVLDSARSTYNLATNMLFPNLSSGETTTAEDNQDFLSNGFKVRTSNQESNINGGTYIYMAFAENPFKYANAR